MINHPTCDDFWKLRSADFSKIQCPVFSIGILHKVGIHLRGNIRGYEEVTTPKKLMLCHGDFEGDEMAIFNSAEMRLLLLRWYDHWLKGNDTGFMDEPPVTLFVRGREVYRPENGLAPAAHRLPQALPHGGPERRRGVAQRRRPLAGRRRRRRRAPTTYSYPDPDWSHFSGIGTAVMEDGVPNPVRKILTFTTPTRCPRTSRSSAASCWCSTPRPTRPTPTSSCASPTSCRTQSRSRACRRAAGCSRAAG